MLKSIKTDKAPKAVGPYSQGIEVGNIIYTSGQLPLDMETNELIIDDIKKATRACMNNVKAVIEEAGSNLDNLVKTTIFVTDMDDFETINEVYSNYFGENKPARSLVEVSKLPKGVNIEIEGIAVKSE